MSVTSLAAWLVEHSSALPPGKRDTVITSVLLASTDADLTTSALQRVRDGKARIDEKLVLDLYASGDRKVKVALASSFAVSRMKPRAFRTVFDPTYARSDLSGQERRALIWSLEAFLLLHPREASRYRDLIVALLRSRQAELRTRAPALLGLLNRFDPAALALLVDNLRSRRTDQRVNTLEGFHRLLGRSAALAPHLRKHLQSKAFRAQVSGMRRSDPDSFVRQNASAVLQLLDRRGG